MIPKQQHIDSYCPKASAYTANEVWPKKPQNIQSPSSARFSSHPLKLLELLEQTIWQFTSTAALELNNLKYSLYSRQMALHMHVVTPPHGIQALRHIGDGTSAKTGKVLQYVRYH